MNAQPKTITRIVNRDQLDKELMQLENEGYLVTQVSDCQMASGSSAKKIEAKHKDAPVRPGLSFED